MRKKSALKAVFEQNPNGFLDRSIYWRFKTVIKTKKREQKRPDEAQEEKRLSLFCFLSSLLALCFVNKEKRNSSMHWPGIEPGPPAWRARILSLNHQRFALDQL